MRRALYCTVAVSLLIAAGVFEWSVSPVRAVPSFERVRGAWCPSDLRVLDRSGEVLHETRTDPARRRLAWTPLAEVSPSLVDAVVFSEDRRFAEHGGVDWWAIVAAAGQRIDGAGRRGASTITMQLAALLDPSLARSSSRRGVEPGRRGLIEKWQQMRAAWSLERAWTKDEILEAYLNLVPLRGEVQGIRAAAYAIFAKAPHGLTAQESSALAASIRAPNAAPAELLPRARRVAARFDADPAAVEEAVRRVASTPDSQGPRTNLAPHAARRLVAGAPSCRDVASSIDAHVQAVAVESLHRRLSDLQDRSAGDGAVLVVDNASGEVLAYVGSAHGLSRSSDVDGVRAKRQAGSSLKPFLYALALGRGLVTPATLLEDEPLEVPVDGSLYRPANYDGNFRGLVSVRTALAASLNIPAVRMLMLAGEDSFVTTLRQLGFDGVTQGGSWYGPSLALGSADVSLWELVGAYRALANRGSWSPLTLRPENARPSRAVFDEQTAWLVGDILADRESRATTFHLENPLATRFWSAVKTGTSKDMRDNWCIGYSSRYTVGVWVGNFSGEPMHDVSGTTGAAPVWNDVMGYLHEDVASDPPARPDGIVDAWTAFARDAEPARSEHYRTGTQPDAATDVARDIAPEPLDEWPRIAVPADGSRFALDPDIPRERQRIPLVARSATAQTVWRLDGRELGHAGKPLMWEPVRGQHELVLADGAQTYGVVRFQVKGTERE